MTRSRHVSYLKYVYKGFEQKKNYCVHAERYFVKHIAVQEKKSPAFSLS
jgi:hypothetical protein